MILAKKLPIVDVQRVASLRQNILPWSTWEQRLELIKFDSIKKFLKRVKAGWPEQERNQTIYWLHHREGLTARQIASIPSIGLTTEGVESVLLRLATMLRSGAVINKTVDPEPASAPNLEPILDGGPKSKAARVLVGRGAAVVVAALIAALVWLLQSR